MEEAQAAPVPQSPESPPPPPPPRRRRRWLRWGVGLLLLLVLALAAAPYAAAPWARSFLVDELESNLRVRAELDRLALTHGGNAHLRGLRMEDLEGRPLLGLADLDVGLDLASVLGGRVVATVEARALEVHLRQAADGTWNFEDLPREDSGSTGGGADPKPRGPEHPGPADPLEKITLSFLLEDGRVFVHEPGGTTELDGLRVEARLDGAKGELDLSMLFGRIAEAGLALHRERTGDREAITLKARADGALGELAPLLRTVAPLRADRRLEGGLKLEVDGDMTLAGGALKAGEWTGHAALEDLAAFDAQGAPLELDARRAAVDFAASYDPDTGKVGIPDLRVDAGPVQLNARAELVHAAGEVPEVTSLSADGRADLDGFKRWLDPWVDTSTLELGGRAALELTSRAADGGLALEASASAEDLVFGTTRLSAKVREKGTLDLQRDRARFAGTVTVEELRLQQADAPEHAVAGLSFDLDAAVANWDDRPGGTLELRGSVAPLRSLLAPHLPPGLAAYADGALALDVRSEPQEGDQAVRWNVEWRTPPGPMAGETITAGGQALVGGDRVLLSDLDVRVPGARVRGEGRVDGLSAAGDADTGATAELALRIEGVVENLLATFSEADGPRPEGDLAGTVSLGWKEAGALTVSGEGSLKELRVPTGAGDFEEPELKLRVESRLLTETSAIHVDQLTFEGRALNGDVSGSLEHFDRLSGGTAEESAENAGTASLRDLRGRLTYVPDVIAAFLEPFLDAQLSGSEPEDVTFDLSAELASLDPEDVLAALRGEAVCGLGQVEKSGFRTSGELRVSMTGEALAATGDLAANGGTLKLDARWDRGAAAPSEVGGAVSDEAESPRGTHLVLDMKDVQTTPRIRDLLAYVHPALGLVTERAAGQVEGVVDGRFELRYAGSHELTTFLKDPAALSLDKVSGAGELQLKGVRIGGSPLISAVSDALGGASDEVRVDPVRFHIREGRVGYDHPWQWTIDGIETKFEGTIGLDRSLALRWRVPVTERLIKKHKVLAAFDGDELTVPIAGSIDKPEVQFLSALSGLATSPVQDPGSLLEKVLGGGAKEPGAKSAAELLKEADRLWAAGDHDAAAPLYREIREKHELSLEYLLNKSRIKRRSRHE